jgi:hypothetical protein
MISNSEMELKKKKDEEKELEKVQFYVKKVF